MNEIRKHISAKLKSWGNGSNSGPRITFDLFQDEDLDALKNSVGKEFYLFLVPVDLETGLPEQSTVEPTENHATVTQQTLRTPFGRKESQEAFLMTTQKTFWEFLERVGGAKINGQPDANVVFKRMIGIKSKKELDEKPNESYIRLVNSFRKFVNRGEI